jgi:hypothetical protein
MNNYKERLKTLQEKFIGKDDFAISMSGEPLKKRGNISFYREDWDETVPFEVWSDSKKSVQLATNAKRKEDGWICADRYCAVHKLPSFKLVEYGHEIEVPGKGTIRGDLMRCSEGGEEYMEGLSYNALKKFNK